MVARRNPSWILCLLLLLGTVVNSRAANGDDYRLMMSRHVYSQVPDPTKRTAEFTQDAQNLLSDNPDIVIKALQKQGTLKDSQGVAIGLLYPNSIVQIEAAQLLNKIGTKDNIEVIIHALDRTYLAVTGGTEDQIANQQLREALLSALARILNTKK